MPYSEINSPSQIANIVPPVIVIRVVAVGSAKAAVNPKFGSTWIPDDWNNLIWPMAFRLAMGIAKK